MAAAKPRRAKRSTTGKPKKGKRRNWQVEDRCDKGKREFTGTLMGTFNFGKKRIPVFSVPKKF